MRWNGVSAAVAERRQGIYVRWYLQRHAALSYFQLRMFLYHPDHRILYDEACRGRAGGEITTGNGAAWGVVLEGRVDQEQNNP